jgi:peroxiredoxin
MSRESPPGLIERPNPLSARVTRVEGERRLAARLQGQELPDIEVMVASHRARIPLLRHLAGLTVLYFVPGENDGNAWIGGIPTPDASQHRGYVRRHDEFGALGARVMGVASQPQPHLLRIGRYLGTDHLLLSDPELQLARALDLPTDEHGLYRRIVLVANRTRIARMFPALDDSEAAGSARQVLAWLTTTGGR